MRSTRNRSASVLGVLALAYGVLVVLVLAYGCSARRTLTPDAKTATLACRTAVAARDAAKKLDLTTMARDVHLAGSHAVEIPVGSKYLKVHNAGVGVVNDTDPTAVADDIAAFLKACHEDGL